MYPDNPSLLQKAGWIAGFLVAVALVAAAQVAESFRTNMPEPPKR